MNNTQFVKKAIELCRMVVEMGEETGNCGVCAGEDDEHEDNCPYPLAKELYDEVREEKTS